MPDQKISRGGSRTAGTPKMERFVIIVNEWSAFAIIDIIIAIITAIFKKRFGGCDGFGGLSGFRGFGGFGGFDRLGGFDGFSGFGGLVL